MAKACFELGENIKYILFRNQGSPLCFTLPDNINIEELPISKYMPFLAS